MNTAPNMDFVVNSYQSGSNWYRVYKSGWVEQGGTTKGEVTITFLKPFADTSYTLIALPVMMNLYAGANDICYNNKNSSSIFIQLRFDGAGQIGFDFMWQACGQGV